MPDIKHLVTINTPVEVVFKAVTRFVNRNSPEGTFRRLRSVMNNELARGGHLSSQPMGALFNYVEIDPATGKENCINFPVQQDNLYRTNVPRMLELVEEHRPELVVFGKSMSQGRPIAARFGSEYRSTARPC